MREFEPKRKLNFFDIDFVFNNLYIIVLGLVFLFGVSYSLTFFVQNKSVASGSLVTGALTVNFTDRSINASNLFAPSTNQDGLNEYVKSLTITNATSIDGIVKLSLSRTSGLALTDMSYAVIVNGAIQEINDVPSNGEILTSAITGSEVINVEVRLWPKTTYTGSETTFVGEITPEINYLGAVASSISSPAGKYVNFNCTGNTCEVWQIVKVENGRLVLTTQANYSGATSRTNSNKYDSTLSYGDSTSLVTSVSTDKKNVYLSRTVKISGGSGTVDDPYNLTNNIFSEKDKKVIAAITYKEGTTTLGTQNVYYNETNFISRNLPSSTYTDWSDGTNYYVPGDTITFTSDTILTAHMIVNANNVSHAGSKSISNALGCSLPGIDGDAQCVIDKIADMLG